VIGPCFQQNLLEDFVAAENFLNFYALGPQEFVILDGVQEPLVLDMLKERL